MTGMFFGHGAKEFSQLAVLADRRPRSLNEFTAKSWVSAMSNRASLGSLSSGVFGGHQTQKSRQLANVFDLAPVSNAGQKLAAHDPAKAELVKLRYFVGLNLREAAEVMGISEPTAKRYWAYARAWLYREMKRG